MLGPQGLARCDKFRTEHADRATAREPGGDGASAEGARGRSPRTRRLLMKDFLQYLFDGLSSGAIYALIAVSLVIVYRGTGHLNFAQGEMAMISAFMAWWLSAHWMPI